MNQRERILLAVLIEWQMLGMLSVVYGLDDTSDLGTFVALLLLWGVGTLVLSVLFVGGKEDK